MKTERKKQTILMNIGVFLAFLSLSTLTFSFFSPIVGTEATVNQYQPGTNGVGAQSGSIAQDSEIAAQINSVISLSAPDNNTYAFEVTPTESGTFQKKTGQVKVKTNNRKGYVLQVKAAATELSGDTTIMTTKIQACNSGATESDTSKDWWGYSATNDAGATSFTPFQTTDQTIKTVSALTTTSEESYDFTIGVKISTLMQSGQYTGTITFTATTNV